jgi:hypothetical protein
MTGHNQVSLALITEKNHLDTVTCSDVKKSIQVYIHFLDLEIEKLEAGIAEIIKQYPALKNNEQYLST